MNLKKLRMEKGATQEEVAKIINKSAVAYGYYESGRNEPDLKTLCQLADYYNVSIDFLINRKWQNSIGYIPEEKKEIVKLIIQLNSINTIKALGYISGLVAGQN